MWKIHGRSSDTDIDCMVIDQVNKGKNDASDNFQFVMAIHTGQYACFATISFITCFINLVQCRYRGFLLSQSCMDLPF